MAELIEGDVVLTWSAPDSRSSVIAEESRRMRELNHSSIDNNRIYRDGSINSLVLLGYLVYKDNTLLTPDPIDDLTYTDENPTDDTEYIYDVTAVYSTGESSPTEEAILVPRFNPPRTLTADAGDSIVELSWLAPITQTYGTITNYNIYRDDTLIDTVIGTLSYSDTPVTNAVTYEYYVTASYTFTNYTNYDDESLPSNLVNARPEDDILMPINLTAALINGNDVLLSWEQGEDDDRSVLPIDSPYGTDRHGGIRILPIDSPYGTEQPPSLRLNLYR